MKKQIQDARDADLDLFREAVEDAEPLRHDRMLPQRPKPPPIPRPRPSELALTDDAGPAALSEQEIETPEDLLFMRPGIQHRVIGELRRGAIEVGLEVDLHGLRVEHAREALAEFLAECTRRRIRCARIIHGKGRGSGGRQPVLKQKVNYWLRLQDQVQAFCSAPRWDGGTGAVYVLLRNPDKARPGRAAR